MMNVEINININEFVECELTEHGKENIIRRGYIPKYENGNFIRIQLWELMHELGDAIFNGADQNIVDNRITILAETDKTGKAQAGFNRQIDNINLIN